MEQLSLIILEEEGTSLCHIHLLGYRHPTDVELEDVEMRGSGTQDVPNIPGGNRVRSSPV